MFPVVVFSSMVLVACGEKKEAPEAEVSGAVLEDVGAEDAAKMIATREDLIILDIRTPEEFAEGHIAGAVNIDYRAEGFAEKIAALDPDKAYLFHCRSGGRSGDSIPILQNAGLTELYHLNTGILGWSKAGQPLAQ